MSRDRRRILGRILIWFGVLAWLPYAWLKYILHADPEMLPFLAVHLAGVIPGVLLARWPQRRPARPKEADPTPEGVQATNDRREAT